MNTREFQKQTYIRFNGNKKSVRLKGAKEIAGTYFSEHLPSNRSNCSFISASVSEATPVFMNNKFSPGLTFHSDNYHTIPGILLSDSVGIAKYIAFCPATRQEFDLI